ncbi:MAG TPA: ATP-binding protein [Methylomirabilota bacterium]|nr:ATP-binding protein [Methylomirabilota bacterium]
MSPHARVFTSRVARRTFVLFVSCALLPVTVLAVLAFRQVTSELRQQSERQLQQASKTVAMNLLQRLLVAEKAMQTTAEQPDRPRGTETEGPVTGVLLSTGTGPDRALSGEMFAPPTLSPQQRSRTTAGKTVLSTQPDAAGQVRFFLSRALDPGHPERGTLHGAVNPAHLWNIQDEAALQPGVKLIVLDESARMLFSSFGSARSLPESVTRRASERTAGHFEWNDGSVEYIATHWALFLQAAFSTPKWTIILTQPKATVLAPIAHFKRTFFLVALLTGLMVLLLSLRQIRKSLTPLEQLQEGTRRLATGDLDTRVAVTSRDEFADPASSFNRMAGQLERQFDALAMRREIGSALSASQTLLESLGTCAEILRRHLDLAVVGVWIIGIDEKAALELHASAVAPGRAVDASRIPVTGAALSRIVRERQLYVTNSRSKDLAGPDFEWAAREGLDAFVGQPLLVDDRLVGVMAGLAVHALDELDASSFAAAAGDIARHVDRRRVEGALHESEVQLRQLQKMEAVGRLAGGIAHDFNNLLTVILGRSRLLLEAMAADHPYCRSVKSIDETAERAAVLTRQLLAFSRKQVLEPALLDLGEVVTGMTDLLQRLIGEQVELVVIPGRDIGKVKADRGQIEQVIVNLVVNARDAMPDGGRITIETSAVETSGPDANGHAEAGPAHVRVAVTDTGTGMDAHTRARIFEPFFTTKEPGKGTGLGLATVYGIVRQSGGSIEVDSEPGTGSTFTVSLPQVEDAPATVDAPTAPARRGTETVLVVEDEAEVRTLVHAVLVGYGYLVMSAARPSEALELAERHPGPIHLLLTDMVMPEMGGPALARKLLATRPEAVVLFVSGYTDDTVSAGPPFLQKPFTPETIARTVRSTLDLVTSAALPRVDSRELSNLD